MAFLRRLSDSLWSYVSPRKTDNANLPTPKSEPVFKKPAIPVRRTPMEELVHHARSMSPNERVGTWHPRSPSSQASSAVSTFKRRHPDTDSPSAGPRRKKYRVEEEARIENDDDTVMDDALSLFDENDGGRTEYDLRDVNARRRSAGRHWRRATLSATPEDDLSIHTTLVVDDDFAEPPSRRIATLPEEHHMRDISDDELRAKGWDDDYITLVQRIALRGYEPLLPSYLKFDYRWLPSELFESSDDGFIGSVHGRHFKASKALERLFQLGGHVRDRIEYQGRVSPERQMRRQIRAFNAWAQHDAGIDQRTAIPILALKFQSADKDPSILINGATSKCRQLAAQYREALRVHRSVELSPEGSDRTLLSYPLPTFYAIIGSGAKLALMAYDPKKGPDEVCAPIAFFDFNEVGYDVWNSLALGIAVCHARNVQMVIAEETGIGLRQPDLSDEEVVVEDPDA